MCSDYLVMAGEAGNDVLAKQIGARLELFERGQVYKEPPPGSDAVSR